MATPTYDLIDSQVLSTSAASVSFTSIPATYRDLVLVQRGPTTADAGGYGLIFNGDTGSNYNVVNMRGDGSAATSASGSSLTFLNLEVGDTSNSSTMAIIQIMDYSATDKHKTVLTRNQTDFVIASAGRWASTAAINSVEFDAGGSTFTSGSTFHLYGIVS